MSNKPIRILLIEDNPIDIDLFNEYLEKDAYLFEVTHVDRLKKGLQLLNEFQFDIILLDLSLPDSFGLETFKRTYSHSPEIPIIVLTGNDDLSLAKFTVSQGAQDFLLKQYLNEYVLPKSIQYAIERDKNQKKLQESQLMLQHSQKMEAVGRLAGGMAHDFNNILAVVCGYCELIVESAEPSNEILDYINEISNAAERGTRLIQQLLLFSRKQPIKPVLLDINEVINNMTIMIKQLITENISLVLNLNPYVVVVRADLSQLHQIILNLVINARDAIKEKESPNHKGILKISTSIAKDIEFDNNKDNDYLKIAIEDNGIGIAENIKDHIFEPFFTTKSIGKGTGLGLASVFGIVKQNNAEITFNSIENEGTVFSIYFPIVNEVIVESGEESDEVEEEKDFNGTDGKTILIVEDDYAVLNMYSKILTKKGYNVIKARNGIKALEIFDNVETLDSIPNLIISDVVMPKMDGIEMAQKIKQLKPEIPFIFLSGYTKGIISSEELKQYGVFLKKPINSKLLVKKVREVIIQSLNKPNNSIK